MKKKRKTRGFTLLELLVTVLASSVIFLTVALIFIMSFWSWRTNNAYAQLRRDAAIATYMMARDVRESSYNGLSDGIGLLTVDSAVPGKPTTTYTQVGDTLIYTSPEDTMVLIPEGLQTFSSLKTNDGVWLTLELENPDHTIAITNEIFANTRN